MNSLDDILAKREPAPAQETETTQAKPEGEAEQTTEQLQEAPEGEQTAEGGKQVPIGAIRQAEREKATKRYTEQVAEFDKRLADQNQAWERRFNTLVERLAPKPEQKPAPDFYENPPAAVMHTVAPQFEEFRGIMQANSRIIAETRHGDELVQEAEAAFSRAYQSGQVDPADAHRVLTSPNVYDAAVKWQKRVKAQAEIGEDPAAYRERVRAEIKAELEGAQGQQQNGGSVVMPSNLAAARNVGSRAGPAWAGPKPLNEIFKR